MAELTDIVLISDFAHIAGGAPKVAIRGAEGLAARGLKVHYFAAVDPVAPEMTQAGVNVVTLGQPPLGKDPSRLRAARRGLWNKDANARLAELLATCPRDSTVVHFHQWQIALSPSVFSVVRCLGFRFTVTFHDYTVACPNGAFYVYPANEICTRRPFSASCIVCNCDPQSRVHKIWRLAQGQVQRRFGKIPSGLRHGIYISPLNRQVTEPHVPGDMTWHFVPNPIDTRKTVRVKAETKSAFYFVGRLAPYKGAAEFAAAAREAGVEAVFVGDGELEDVVKNANPDARITGWVPSEAVFDELSQARALVFPSTWYESQGLVVLEAQSRGVPPIVSDGCAAAGFVEDGKTGLHAKLGSVADLTEKLKALADDKAVERLSQQAYDAFWKTPPLLDNHVDHLITAYKVIVADRAA